MNAINIHEKLSTFWTYWDPKIISELNGQYVKLVKFKGEFVWHHHETEDELFFVLKGELMMKFRDRDVLVREGEMIVVPRMVEHKPVAAEEVHVMLFEPSTTLNTGNVVNDRTKPTLDRI